MGRWETAPHASFESSPSLGISDSPAFGGLVVPWFSNTVHGWGGLAAPEALGVGVWGELFIIFKDFMTYF